MKMLINKLILRLYHLKYEIKNIFYNLKLKKIGKRVKIDNVTFINGNSRSNKGIILEDDCFIKRETVLITDKSRKNSGIILKKRSGINMNCYFGGEGGIEIGENTQIGPHVCMLSTNHTFSNKKKPIRDQPLVYKKIIIENDVWIGANVTILAGIKIGKGSVIGAGALVNKDIPEYSIAVGVPAKVIKKR